MPRHLPILPDEPPVVTTDETGAVWRRTGYCCGCGACCRGDAFGGQLGAPEVEGMCFMYREDVGCSDKTNPVYVNACSKWPTHSHQIADKPDCTYRIERVS